MILTPNERYVLRFVAAHQRKDYSMNNIARECSVSPNGAYKILTKLEREGVLKAKSIANIKAYKLDFSTEKTTRILELAFMPDLLEGRVKSRADDLKPLNAVVQACVLFGSYITTKKEPRDLDVLFIVERTNYEVYKQVLSKVQDITPVKIQDVVQTTDDVLRNLKNEDPIIIVALGEGIVLWGHDIIVQVIKNENRRETEEVH